MEPISTLTKNGFTANIYYDEDTESPREYDNVGTMVCWHSRYKLGDEQPSLGPQEWLDSLLTGAAADRLERIEHCFNELPCSLSKDYEWVPFKTKARTHKWLQQEHARTREAYLNTNLVMLPLYLLDHGSISMSTGAFSCQRDSGRVGWIYCTMDRARQEWEGSDEEVRAKAIACLQSEVEEYDRYIRGECYGFEITNDATGETEDACCGFLGYDYIEKEVNFLLDSLSSESTDAQQPK